MCLLKWHQNIFLAIRKQNRKKFARNLLIPIIENQISKREVIHKLTEEQMLYGIREVLEDISDMEESYA